MGADGGWRKVHQWMKMMDVDDVCQKMENESSILSCYFYLLKLKNDNDDIARLVTSILHM